MIALFGTIRFMTDESDLRALLAPIRERNRARLLERLGHVRDAIAAAPSALSQDLRNDLHALVGALGTYGWPAGSALLTRIQDRLTCGDAADEYLEPLDSLIDEVATP